MFKEAKNNHIDFQNIEVLNSVDSIPSIINMFKSIIVPGRDSADEWDSIAGLYYYNFLHNTSVNNICK